MEFKKGMSVYVLYTGLIILAIGAFLTFKPKPIPGGMIVMFIGFITSIFWVSNRKDEMCPTDPNDDRPCTPLADIPMEP